MRKFLLAVILLSATTSFATQYIYKVLVVNGLVSISSIGSGARGDAQIEFRNEGSGHALISSALMQNPGNTVNENAWSGQAYSSNGNLVQQGAFYMRWMDTNGVNGFSAVGAHPTYFDNGNIVADVAFEVYGNHGIGMFLGPNATPPSNRFLMIKRTPGVPSVTGTSDLVLDANGSDIPDNVFLNGFNSGHVIAALGGGNLGVGTQSFGNGSSSVISIKNGTCPLASVKGTGTLCVNSNGQLTFVGQNGTTTILAEQ